MRPVKPTPVSDPLAVPGDAPSRILLIGCGAFARQAHLPALAKAGKSIRLVAVVDRACMAEDVRAACARAGCRGDVSFVEFPELHDNDRYSAKFQASARTSDTRAPHPDPQYIEALASRLPEVDAVVISSPEGTHGPYIRWALERGLPTLVDKPLTVRRALGETLSDPEELIYDWLDFCQRARPGVPFMLAAQRRYQGIYRQIAARVRREYLTSGYGPTYVQCLTNDGLWHAPGDYATQPTYRHGAGKLIHTGYHVLDIVPWIIRHAQGAERPGAAVARICSATIFASGFRPADAAAAWTPEEGKEAACATYPATLGEVNAALLVTLRDDRDRTVCIIQIGTLHEGLSLNPMAPAETLDKRRVQAEAGRNKQEILSIYMGPTAAIWLRRFAKLTGSAGTELGDRDHLEIVHGRNPRVAGAPAFLEVQTLTYEADDDAPTAEFLRALRDPTPVVISPVNDHGIGVRLLAAAYHSMEAGEPVRVSFGAREWAMPPGSPLGPGTEASV